MSWQHTFYVYPILSGTVVSLVLGTYALVSLRRKGHDPILLLFSGIMVGLALWSGFSALKLLSTDESTKHLFYYLLHLGVALLGPLSLLFALAYTDRRRWIRPSVAAALFVVPLGYVLLLVWNPGNIAWESARMLDVEGLSGTIVVMRVEDGPAHAAFVLVTIGYVLFALAIIAYEAVRLGRRYLSQAALISIAITAPILFNAFAILGVPPFDPDGVNLVPVSTVVTALALAIAVFRYQWLDLPPIAYTTAIRDSPNGVLVLDTDGRVVHANDRGEALLDQCGATPGDTIHTVVPEVELPRSTQATDQVTEVEPTDGTVAFFEVRARQLNRGGRHVGWVLVFTDVTERHRRRERLESQKEQLDQFASIVSHDLRNPLNVARLYIESERDSSDGDTTNLDRATEALDRIERIVDDTLTLAREGKQVTEVEQVDLGALARQSWLQVETPDATLDVEDGIRISCDPGRMHHLFENLFGNAVTHGGPTVTVRTGSLDGGFFVEDDGPGIPEEHHDSAFEAGYTTADDGTGFGLSIVGQIADAHGWDVHLTRSTEGGARFEFTGIDGG